ncbi:MAG: hypothetical protein QGI06_04195 [Rhodospirillales bacterium]|jgi:hypothetical protein|nr:hypothetical protein [Rhodospirillales bacterium]|tara:strand:- start:366 stop:548 length:183 start_codon:yes stop_codon:yes gene_type:complete
MIIAPISDMHSRPEGGDFLHDVVESHALRPVGLDIVPDLKSGIVGGGGSMPSVLASITTG